MIDEQPTPPAPEPQPEIIVPHAARAELLLLVLKYGLDRFDECTASGDEE